MNFKERQHFRDRKNGQYKETPKCESCGRNPRYKLPNGEIIHYFSNPNCNKTGLGLILCIKCAEKP